MQGRRGSVEGGGIAACQVPRLPALSPGWTNEEGSDDGGACGRAGAAPLAMATGLATARAGRAAPVAHLEDGVEGQLDRLPGRVVLAVLVHQEVAGLLRRVHRGWRSGQQLVRELLLGGWSTRKLRANVDRRERVTRSRLTDSSLPSSSLAPLAPSPTPSPNAHLLHLLKAGLPADAQPLVHVALFEAREDLGRWRRRLALRRVHPAAAGGHAAGRARRLAAPHVPLLPLPLRRRQAAGPADGVCVM